MSSLTATPKMTSKIVKIELPVLATDKSNLLTWLPQMKRALIAEDLWYGVIEHQEAMLETRELNLSAFKLGEPPGPLTKKMIHKDFKNFFGKDARAGLIIAACVTGTMIRKVMSIIRARDIWEYLIPDITSTDLTQIDVRLNATKLDDFTSAEAFIDEMLDIEHSFSIIHELLGLEDNKTIVFDKALYQVLRSDKFKRIGKYFIHEKGP